MKTVDTDRLCLRQFSSEDVDRLYSVIGAEGVLDYFPGNATPSREMAARMIESILAHWDQHGFGLWALETGGTGAFLGRCGLQYLPETDEIEVDFVLDPAVWGRGYATEAARASLEYGFECLDADEIVGIVHPDNAASRRVLEKIGMTHTGRETYFGMTVERYARTR